MTVNVNILARINGFQTAQSAQLSGGVTGANLDTYGTLSVVPGTSTGQADVAYFESRTLAASATENLDLNAGSLVQPNGATATFAKVRGLLITAAAANTNDVIVGGAASNGWVTPFGAATHTVTIKPGGSFMLQCPVGYAVTAATGDLLKIANSSSGSAVTYSIAIVGTSV